MEEHKVVGKSRRRRAKAVLRVGVLGKLRAYFFAGILVMAPIAATVANEIGSSQDAFLMAVALGASCAFLTPIGHQNNLLVMGPGGYRLGYYWRMGLPLETLIVLIGTPLIAFIWGI